MITSFKLVKKPHIKNKAVAIDIARTSVEVRWLVIAAGELGFSVIAMKNGLSFS